MNWLDSASLSSLATSAFKSAQKKIDKILEIQDGDGADHVISHVASADDGDDESEREARETMQPPEMENSDEHSNLAFEMPVKISTLHTSSIVPKVDVVDERSLPNTTNPVCQDASIPDKAEDSELHPHIPTELKSSENEWAESLPFEPVEPVMEERHSNLSNSVEKLSISVKEQVEDKDQTSRDQAFADVVPDDVSLKSSNEDFAFNPQNDDINLNPSNSEPAVTKSRPISCATKNDPDVLPAENSTLNPTNTSGFTAAQTNADDLAQSPTRRPPMGKSFVLHSVSHSALFQDLAEIYEGPPSSSHPELSFSVVHEVTDNSFLPDQPNQEFGTLNEDAVASSTDLALSGSGLTCVIPQCPDDPFNIFDPNNPSEDDNYQASDGERSQTPTNFSSDIEVLSLPTTHPPSSLCSLCSDIPEEDPSYYPLLTDFPTSQPAPYPIWTPRGFNYSSGLNSGQRPGLAKKRRGLLEPAGWPGHGFEFLFRENGDFNFDPFTSIGTRSRGAKYKSCPTGPIMNSMHSPLATHQKSGQNLVNQDAPGSGHPMDESIEMPSEHLKVIPLQILRGEENLSVMTNETDAVAVSQAREQQIMKLFKENLDLKEQLAKKGEHDEQVSDKATSDLQNNNDDLKTQIDALREEFACRIAESEKKLLSANRERDNLKKQLKRQDEEAFAYSVVSTQPVIPPPKGTQDSGSTSKPPKNASGPDVSQLNRTLAEKEQIINELMEEGNKLAKQQLGNSALIKKLRAREKELETNLSSQTKKNEELTAEVSKAKESVNKREALERDQNVLLQEASADLILRADKITELESKLLETTEKARSMETALEAAYKEIGALHKSLAEKNYAIEEAERKRVENVESAVADVKLQLEKEDEGKRKSLYQEISDLQNELVRQTKSLKSREQNHQREVDDLREALKSSEARCQDLSQNLSGATRPLVRQIDDLQQLINTQKISWEKVEYNLTQRLGEAETCANEGREIERRLKYELEREKDQTKASQTLIKELQEERDHLNQSFQATQSKLENVTAELASYKGEMGRSQASLTDELEELKEENEKLRENVASLSLTVKRYSSALQSQVSIYQQNKEANHHGLERSKMYRRRDRIQRYSSMDSGEQYNQSFDSVSSDLPDIPTFALLERTMDKEERQVFTNNSSAHNNEDDLSVSSIADNDLNYRTRSSPLSITPTNLFDSPPSIAPSHSTTIHSNGSVPVVFEKLEFHLKMKEGELYQLQGEIHKLERSRESMAHELVRLTSRCDSMARVESDLEGLKSEHADLGRRYNTVLQMYGEKAEEADELRMDLQDLKLSYRNQMDILIPSPNACLREK